MSGEDNDSDVEKALSTAPPEKMPVHFFFLGLSYLASLIALFVIYGTSPSIRQVVPSSMGPLPIGVAWFGATGAVISSLRGIFSNNQNWKSEMNYWHYSRPIFGAVTGSVGALLYWVSLRLGSNGPVSVDQATFYAVAFLLGFADKAFTEMLKNVTDVIVKPGQKSK